MCGKRRMRDQRVAAGFTRRQCLQALQLTPGGRDRSSWNLRHRLLSHRRQRASCQRAAAPRDLRQQAGSLQVAAPEGFAEGLQTNWRAGAGARRCAMVDAVLSREARASNVTVPHPVKLFRSLRESVMTHDMPGW